MFTPHAAVPSHVTSHVCIGLQGEGAWEGGSGRRGRETQGKVLHSKLVLCRDQDWGESTTDLSTILAVFVVGGAMGGAIDSGIFYFRC